MIDYRKNSVTGDLYVPVKGDPPPEPVGYKRDEKQPFVFHPILDECQYRSYQHIKTCCNTRTTLICGLYKLAIPVARCIGCRERKAPDVSTDVPASLQDE